MKINLTKKIIIIILLSLNLGILFKSFTNYVYGNDQIFITVNNLSSFKMMERYWGKQATDYVYQFIRIYLSKLIKQNSNISSFKEISKIKDIHNRIQSKINSTPIKIKVLLLYVDDLLYNYSDILYKDLLQLKNNFNPTNSKIQNKSYYDNNKKDNLNKELLKEFCTNFTKTAVDYGCGTKEPSNSAYKALVGRGTRLKNNKIIAISKYDIQKALITLNNIDWIAFKNFLYKSIYLCSSGYIYATFFTKNGYETNVWNIWVNKHDSQNDKIWMELRDKILKYLKTPSETTIYKNTMKFLQK